MPCLYKYSLFFLFFISYFDYQLQAAGTIKSLFTSKKTREQQLLKEWFSAVSTGNIEIIQNLISKVDVNTPDEFGSSALDHACWTDNTNLVKLLLQAPKINVNRKNQYGDTALMKASLRGHENIVRLLLLVTEINVNAQNNHGSTALLNACWNGHENIIKLLLQIPGINVYIQTEEGNIALLFASLKGTENAVKLLLQMPGINVNAQNKHGDTALINACWNGHENIVKLLLEVPGININAQTKDGKNALMSALLCDNGNIVKLLLKFSDIDVNATNKDGETALRLARERGHPVTEHIIKNELISKAFESMAVLSKTSAPAERNKDLEYLKAIIIELKPYSIDNIFDQNGNTLLDKAFAVNCPEIIFYLLQNTKDPQESLARFPFEQINPTSDLFKYFVNLAFDLGPEEIVKTEAHLDKDKKTSKSSLCQVCFKATDAKCSGCKKIYYCSAKCQKTDWHNHKLVCKLIEGSNAIFI